MNIKYIFVGILVSAIISLASCGGGGKPNHKAPLKSEADSAFYYLGIHFGASMVMWGFDEVNYRALAKGMEEAFRAGKDIGNDEEKIMELNMFLNSYIPKIQALANEKENEKNLKEGEKFLEANKKKSGVVPTPSGLQYKIIREGTGIKPAKQDMVEVVYHGTLIDGTMFDSSKVRGDTATFSLSRVVEGFSEALTLMNEGSIWEVYIPAELGYGTNPPRGNIKSNSVLIFEIDLVKVIKPVPVE